MNEDVLCALNLNLNISVVFSVELFKRLNELFGDSKGFLF
jgi:hypothetical protein